MNKNSKYAWFNTILTATILVLLVAIVANTNKYAQLLKNEFIIVNVVFLIVALGLILLSVKSNSSNRKKAKTFYSVFLVILLAGSVYGFYLINIINTTVKDITSESSKIDYTASFVVYDSPMLELEDLKNKTLGIIESEEFIEGNLLPKAEIEKLDYDKVNFKTYQSYTKLINALVKDEVDFISLPEDYKNIYSTNEQVEPNLSKMRSIHTFSGKYDNISKISGSNIDVTKVPFTVLLMGNDGGRTDTLMLASVNPKSMQITLTSIARDSFVPIACYPGQSRDKINHSRMISRDCTIKTVENLLDLSIDFFVEINFQGVVDLVNSLGTLTIDSPASFHGNIETGEGGGVFIPEGVSELDGNQVLAFVRERASFAAGDFQRQQNQQQVIDALLSKVIETRDVNKVINLIKATGKNVETNLSLSQLIDLMKLGIVKMESTYLNNAEIFTIYGNRITGRGELMYSAEYNMELYYYILYNGSITDAKDFIAMNTRSDGILEIPRGFNYKYTDEYLPPVFGEEEYYEQIDDDIIINDQPQWEPEEEEEEEVIEEPVEPKGEIEVKSFSGLRLNDLVSFLDSNSVYYNIVNIEEKFTDDQDLIGKKYVINNNPGYYSEGDTVSVSITEYKETVTVEPEEPEVDPNPENESSEEDTGSSDSNGNKPGNDA